MKEMRLPWVFRAVVLLSAGCLTLALGGCGKKAEEGDTARLPDITGKKVVMIIARDHFRDEELFKPKEIIEKAGGRVTVASSTLNEAKGMLGKTYKPDILLTNIKADEFDAVVFIGGAGASEYWTDSNAHLVAKSAAEKGKLVCAICIAPVTLANAGLLDGKKATVWKSEASKIKAKGATYTGADVEVDGKLVTANGPESAARFGRAIVRALGS
jgi:protease I